MDSGAPGKAFSSAERMNMALLRHETRACGSGEPIRTGVHGALDTPAVPRSLSARSTGGHGRRK
ncbi:hypothetical protein SAM23877_0448 [Streptomyces ambofaciens ATCC 23877]|uniref:Uncharacterized protein n=1 Tax=Streptomyces ambofaciens (strain ATCC 23877 / 3486 / DSM 40053 / JCM 4204 / NBRC 12836 / NRRL B-2516) TaxID=278992 RepID=A0A0K2AKW1_STRA7|nr:hypothetical protein SAM23877_0448 [Streptomyces ambofaciens ATCC 23877]